MSASPKQLRVKLKRLVPDGPALGRVDKRLVLAWGGLPDEEVTVEVTRRKRHTYWGLVRQVHQASPLRVEPQEAHFLSCSPWQILRESEEAAVKARLVAELCRKAGFEPPEFEVVEDGRFFGYRNKVEFSFTEQDGRLCLAFYQRGSYRRQQPVDGCRLATPALNEAARKVLELLQRTGVRAASLKSLVLRGNRRGEVVAALFCREPLPSPLETPDPSSPLVGLRVFFSDPQSPAAVATEELQRWGRPTLVESVLDRRLTYSDCSFFQVNVPVFEAALQEIREAVLPDGRVYDLYAGVGTIGICLGRPGTVFVESHDETAGFLEQNCRDNGLRDPQFIRAPLEKQWPTVERDATVVLDPPRSGCHPKVVRNLLRDAPRRIVYLSCNPATQARDLAPLLERYELAHYRVFNFFPRTPHAEALAVLDRRN